MCDGSPFKPYTPDVGNAKMHEVNEGPALEESCEMTKYALLWWLILKQVMLVGLHRF